MDFASGVTTLGCSFWSDLLSRHCVLFCCHFCAGVQRLLCVTTCELLLFSCLQWMKDEPDVLQLVVESRVLTRALMD